ncbi:MAG: glycosyltransferase family 1 protein [Betaproteobacteria bacterium]|jgi:glycosyltransferase involved in cell wall biosynthesis|nr:glycosyltransferase family 1 protein [Betaproteobacteria bacterium]NBY17982.1 glycosyltransferase family 1 protein [Betaproteobacteria bacterium]
MLEEPDRVRAELDTLPERPLRIAFVTETYPPEVNGVAMTLAELVRRLQARQHQITLIRPRQGHERVGQTSPSANQTSQVNGRLPIEEFLVHGVQIPRYSQLRMGLPAKRFLIQQWTSQRPDVVHIATEGPLGWSALQAARRLTLPVSTDFRTNFHAYSGHYGLRWLYKPIMGYLRTFHNLAHCTTVPTKTLQAQLAASGFERLSVVARGIDAERFHPRHRCEALRAQWGLAEGDFAVLYVGRLAAEKNLDGLAVAFEAIERANPRARLILVGDGPMRAALETRLPKALFCGQQMGHDLARCYASADLFLFPSKTETFGNVTVEAMASGLPVVAFADGAALELVRTDENGASVDLADDAGYVSEATRLALNAAACRHMGVSARATALQLDWETIANRFEFVIRGAIQSELEPNQNSQVNAPRPIPLR